MDQREAAIKILKSIDDLFDQIAKLQIPKPDLFGPEREQAQALLRELKGKLNFHCDDLYKRRDKLNSYERDYLEHALLACRANLRTKVGSKPSQLWVHDLSCAREDISDSLYELERSE